MGQAYCVTLCGQKSQIQSLKIQGMTNQVSDQPVPLFAKKVKQHIQIHPKIKQIYLNYRMLHPSEQKGVKLQLYYMFAFSAYYEGEWKCGLPHGFGRVIYDDGSIYEGCFNNGMANCDQAFFVRRDGSFYRGQIRNNKANGDGQLSTCKFFYKGKWHNDLPHGKARELYNTHSFYEGQFYKGVKFGQGYYRWNQEQYYVGRFQNNKIEGKGKLETKDFVYQGQFKNDKKEGFGEYSDKKNKFKYIGQFRANFPFGKGRITYADNTVFTGVFDGFQNRKGVLSLHTGETIEINTSDLSSEPCSLDVQGQQQIKIIEI